MFVSMPNFHFPVPAALAKPGATYARAMSLSTFAAWYVMTVRHQRPAPTTETFLFALDFDVVEALRADWPDAEVESLMLVAPHPKSGPPGWFTKRVVEVWTATNPHEGDNACVLMLTDDGKEHSGWFMEPALGVKRGKLIARPGRSRLKRAKSQ